MDNQVKPPQGTPAYRGSLRADAASHDLDSLIEQCEKLRDECVQAGAHKEKLQQLLDLNAQISERIERRKAQNEIERLKTELHEYKHRMKILGQSSAKQESVTNKNSKPNKVGQNRMKENVPETRPNPRVLPETAAVPPSFKISVMKQLEELFITEGQRINEDGGFQIWLVRRAMDISKEMSDGDLEKMERNIGRPDTDVTSKVRSIKKLALLRFFYLENFNSSGLIDIDAFMEVHLKDVGREELLVQWNVKKQEALLESLGGLLPGFDDLFHSMIETGLIPEIKGLLCRLASKLSPKEISALKKTTSKRVDDKEILVCLVLERQRKTNNLGWGTDDLRTFLTEVFQNIDRIDLLKCLDFELHKIEVKQLLRGFSRKLSQTEKETIRNQLNNPEMCDKDEEILEFYLWAKSSEDEESTHEKLKKCMEELFRNLDNEKLYQELVEGIDKLGGLTSVMNIVLRELGLKLSKDELNVLRAKYTDLPEGLNNESLLLHIVMSESQGHGWKIENLRKFFTGLLEKLNRGDLLKYFDYFLHKAVLKPPVKAILRKFSIELSDDEKVRAKKEIEKTIDLDTDDEILECYQWVKRKEDPSLDNLIECMKELFESLGNDRTCERLLGELRKLNEGLKPSVVKMLMKTCKELSTEEKANLKSKLVDSEPELDDDDILLHLVLQESRNKSWTLELLREFMCRTLSEQGFQIFKKYSPEDSKDPRQKLLESLFKDPKDDIRERLEDLADKVNTLIDRQKQQTIGKPSGD